jgi:hypothetical protein
LSVFLNLQLYSASDITDKEDDVDGAWNIYRKDYSFGNKREETT